MITSVQHKDSVEASKAKDPSLLSKKETAFASLLQSLGENKKAALPSKEERIQNSVSQASAKYGLDPALIKAVIKQESGFNPQAKSPVGAQGLMQLMPGTAKDLGVKDSFSIEQNIDGGSKYLRDMLERFDGKLDHALAAYNAGPGAVEKHKGVPPYAETKNYVTSVKSHYESFRSSNNDDPQIAKIIPVANDKTQPVVDVKLIASHVAMDFVLSSSISSQPVRLPEHTRLEEPPPPPPPGMRV